MTTFFHCVVPSSILFLIEFSLIMVIFFGLKNQKISSKKAKILAFNSFLLLIPIFELLNEIGLINFNIRAFDFFNFIF